MKETEKTELIAVIREGESYLAYREVRRLVLAGTTTSEILHILERNWQIRANQLDKLFPLSNVSFLQEGRC